MFRRGEIGIQIKRLSFPREIVEFSLCNRLLNFLINAFLKRHGFASKEKEISMEGCRGNYAELATEWALGSAID
jgi:hypothetical protein